MTTERIRQLNDLFRKAGIGRGQIVTTEGFRAFDDNIQKAILCAVRAFDAFTEENDPHGEHDFGSLDFADKKIFWKIDYYNLTLDGGSENPADEEQTKRVLTIMLASEY